jgi:hypothetical protein
MPWAKGAIPDTESGVEWGVNWVVRSPEAMGGERSFAASAGRLQTDVNRQALVCPTASTDAKLRSTPIPIIGGTRSKWHAGPRKQTFT